MKYVAFLAPDEFWHGLDWVYDLCEDDSNYNFYFIEAKKPSTARELVANEHYINDMQQGGLDFIVERAFNQLCGFEFENDEEVYEYFGEKDGKTVFEFYKKYTWDDLTDGKYSLFGFSSETKKIDKEDVDKFYDFNKEILEKLYKENIMRDILVMPIVKTLK